ncbi:hypothetical protein [uncultured Sphingomonas sp.]|uniref:hypothetical protein n=1 Tax=uncultured Sphingomonas sp. TaxID=158754 RepID=UPI0035CB5A51
MGVHFKLAPDHRAAIEDQIESLIAMLDSFDGCPDLEEDDWPGDPLEIDGEPSSDDGRPLLRTVPWYAADQREGPTNYRSASKRHMARELGLVRSASGGWQHTC